MMEIVDGNWRESQELSLAIRSGPFPVLLRHSDFRNAFAFSFLDPFRESDSPAMSAIATRLPESRRSADHRFRSFSSRMYRKPGSRHACVTNR